MGNRHFNFLPRVREASTTSRYSNREFYTSVITMKHQHS